MTRLAAKILKLFQAHGHLTEITYVELQRVHAGYWQRSRGAWSWYLFAEGHPELIAYGSQWAATELAVLKPNAVSVSISSTGDVHMDPEATRAKKTL